jgi:hypothetical protein
MRCAAFGKERKSKRFLSLRRTYSSSVMLRSDVVAGMPDNLFAHVGWHFGVSQPRNKTVTKAVEIKGFELPAFTSLFGPERSSNASQAH